MRKDLRKIVSVLVSITLLFSLIIFPVQSTAIVAGLTGTVKDTSGNMIDDFKIFIQNKNANNGLYYNFTESNGTFILSGSIADGDYSVRALPVSGMEAPSIVKTIKIQGGLLTQIDGQACSSDTALDLVFTAPSIHGVLYTPDNLPIAGVVYLYGITSSSSTESVYSINTNSDGTFAIGGLEPNRHYGVTAWPKENSTFTYSRADFTTDSNGNPTITQMNLTLQKINLKAKVLSANNSDVTNSTRLNIVAVNGNSVGLKALTNTDSIVVSGLSDGEYKLCAVPTAQYTNNESASQIKTIVVQNGEVKSIDGIPSAGIPVMTFQLTQPQLKVQVYGPNNTVIPQCSVNVYEKDDYQKLLYTQNVRDNGEIFIGALESGRTYSIQALPPPKSDYRSSESFNVTINSDGTYTGLNPLTIQLTVGSKIIGTVKDSAGNLAKDYQINVKNISTGFNTREEQYTNSLTGAYEILQLGDGDYSFTAIPLSGNDSPSVPKRLTILGGKVTSINGQACGENISVDLDFTVPALYGRLLKPDNTAVAGGTIVLYDKTNYYFLYNIKTNTDGSFSLGGLEPNKSYEIYGQSNDSALGNSKRVAFTTNDKGDPDISQIDLVLNRILLKATILNTMNNNAINNGYLIPKNISGGNINYNTSRFDGKINLSGLDDGEYLLYALPTANDPIANESISNYIKIEVKDDLVTSVNNSPVTGIPELTFTFSQPQLKVEAKGVGGEAISYGQIDIYENNEAQNNIYSQSVRANGEVYIGGLEAGKSYILKFYPSTNSSYTISEKYYVTINSDGSYTGQSPLVINLKKPLIVGKVTGYSGEPIYNGSVEIQDSSYNYLNGMSIDGEGKFKFGALKDGVYILKANTWNNPQFTPSDEIRIEVRTEGNEQYIYDKATGIKYTDLSGDNPLILKLNPVVLQGSVKDPLGRAVKWGYVGISKVTSNGTQGVAGVSTDDFGKFSLGKLEAGTYILKAQANADSIYTYSDEVYITVTSDGKILDSGNTAYSESNPLILTLNEPQLVGYVVYPDGTSAANGYIDILKKLDPKGDKWLPSVGYANGKFSLGGLDSGEYVLKAYPQISSAYTCSQDVSILVAVGESGTTITRKNDGSAINAQNPLKISLTQPLLTGRILNPDGGPAIYPWIQVSDALTGNPVTGVGSDNAGAFKLGFLNDGSYIIKAYPNGSGIYTPSESVLVEISRNGSIINVQEGYDRDNFVIKLKSPQIKGVVYGPVASADENVPQSSGWVEIRDAQNNWYEGVGIDDTGTFTIGGLENGTYYLQANPDPQSNNRYTVSPSTPVVIVNGEPEQTIDFHLTNPQVTGKVLNPYGSEVTWAGIDVYNSQGWVTSTLTNSNGGFSIGLLADGDYSVKAYPAIDSAYSSSAAVDIHITGGLCVNGPLEIKLQTPMLTGEIRESDGLTLSSCGQVDIEKIKENGDYDYIASICGDQNGRFKLPILEDGKYALKAIPESLSNNAPSGKVIIFVSTEGANKVVRSNNGAVYDSDSNKLMLAYSPVKVRGTVSTPDGQSKIGFGSVNLYRINLFGFREYVTGAPVSESGEFKFSRLPEGEYIIRAYPNYRDSYTPSLEYELTIDQSGNCTSFNHMPNAAINLPLTVPLLKGEIKNPDGSAAAFSFVDIQKLDGNNKWISIDGLGLSSTGSYCIGALTAGEYKIQAYPGNDNTNATPSEEILFTVDNNGSITTDLPLIDGKLIISLTSPQIAGILYQSNHAFSKYGWVGVIDSSGNFITGTGVSLYGKFSLSGLAAGSYKLIAYPGPDSTDTPSEPFSITIGEGTGYEANIYLTTAMISGTVSDQNNVLTDKGWVEVRKNDGTDCFGIGLQSDGSFYLKQLEAGEYTIQAIAAPGTGASSSAISKLQVTTEGSILLDATTVSAIYLKLTSPKKIGSIMNLLGNNNDAWVEIGDAASNWLFTVPVAADGTFALPALEADEIYTIQAFQMVAGVKRSSIIQNMQIDSSGNYPEQILLSINYN